MQSVSDADVKPMYERVGAGTYVDGPRIPFLVVCLSGGNNTSQLLYWYAYVHYLWLGCFFPWGIISLQNYWSLSCDPGLDNVS